MLQAKAVVGPTGPDTLFASLIKRPVIVLHDLKTYRERFEPARETGDGPVLEGKPPAMAFGKPILFNVVDSLQQHLKPPVDECAGDCRTCAYGSCVEQISPEWIFDCVKTILMPRT